MQNPNKTISLYRGKVVIDFWEEKHWYIRRDIGKIITSVTGATGMIMDANILMAWAIKLAKNHLIEIIEAGGMVLREDIFDACGLYRKRRDEARDIGTAVHDWIERYIKSKLSLGAEIGLPTGPKVMNGVIAFKQWVDENDVEFEASEQIVYMAWYKNYATGELITISQYLKLKAKEKKGFELIRDYVGTLDCRAKIGGKLTLIDFKTGNYLANTVPWQVSAYLEADAEESGRKYEDRMVLHIKKDTGDFEAKHLGMAEHKMDFNAFVGTLIAKNRTKKGGGEM